MAFLHSVLKDVHDKQPYKVGSGQLNNVVESLRNALCKGHEGFQSVIAEVASGVGRYNREVEGSNDGVKEKIEELYNYVSSNEPGKLLTEIGEIPDEKAFKTYSAKDVEQAVLNAGELVDKCFNKGNKFENDIVLLEKYVDDFNPSLKVEVNTARRNIKHETKRLGDLAIQLFGNFGLMKSIINETLRKLRMEVHSKIRTDVKALVNNLKKKVEEIRSKFEDINKLVKEYVNDLASWIDEAEQIVKQAEGRVKKILEQVKEDEKSENRNAVEVVVENVGNRIGKEISNLKTWSSQARDVVEKAEGKCKEILEKVKDNGTSPIYVAATELKNRARSLLQAYDSSKDKISRMVGKVSEAVGNLEGKIKEDLYTLKGTINSVIETYVSTLHEAAKDGRSLGNIAHQLGEEPAGSLRKWLVDAERGFHGKVPNSTTLQQVLSSLCYDSSGTRMSVNESAYKAIEKDIKGGIEKKLPDETDSSDPLIQPTKVKLEGTNFMNYKSTKSELTDAIPKFLSEGLNAYFKKSGVAEKEFSQEINDLDIPLQNIVQGLTALTALVSKNDPGSLERDPEKGIKTLLCDLNKGLGNVRSNFWATFSNGLGNIQDTLEKLRNDVPEVTAKLAALCAAISTEGTHSKYNLEDFRKKNINFRLKQIKELIDGMRTNNVREAITLAHNFISIEADEAGQATIEAIQSFVNTQVSSAISTLTTRARRNYVTSVKQLLTAFAAKVTQELSPLPAQIEEDLRIGFKGFMRKFGEKFVNRVKDIKDVKAYISVVDPLQYSPLTQGTKILNRGFEDLFPILQDQEDFKPDFYKVAPFKEALTTLLTGLISSQHFNNDFSNNLDALEKSVTALGPKIYGEGNSPLLLNALRKGFPALVKELKKGYVSSYSGRTFGQLLKQKSVDAKNVPAVTPGAVSPKVAPSVPPNTISSASAQKAETEYELTTEGKNCAKVCVTILRTVYDGIRKLVYECDQYWDKHTLFELNGDKENPLGAYLKHCGYKVATNQDSKDGELKFPLTNYKGQKIYDNLQRTINDAKKNSHLTACKPNEKGENFNVSDILSCIIKHLNQYNNVCHLNHIDSPKSPTTVNQMLQWCAGLRYHRVYEPLKQHLNSLFANDHSDFSYKIHTLAEFDLEVLCNYSHKLLTSILGTGDEHTVYASDYQNNALNFYYPSTPSQCLDMLLDILRRFLPTLRFLQNQCQLRAIHHGWYDCKYGKDIAPAKLPCDNHSHSKPTCQPSDQPNTQPNCQPTSPLMSYLNDCLPGHLPHQLSSIGCRATCNTCPKASLGNHA
ncbi:hypothetical protein, conserved [Babesia ovata]|uniref:Extracellular matrix-binding ebh n=1 Tax=Babesia ovata TaxID=189622 RepID=A0A2H6KJJ7_9APIC|nr:uncharacterized protein BOVATA_046570 [Babesia ovata]GBE63164.1 hypothetical protein, conserved [Babesia ovata]